MRIDYGEYVILPPKIGILLCVVYIFSAAGCDPVRTTLQPVHLQITNSVSGRAVAGAQVWLKYDLDRGERIKGEVQWYSGVADERGQAIVGIEYTVLDRSRGPKPPSWRDWVSGQPYLIKLREDQVHEELSLFMQPGASVQGKFFAVSILEIRKPRYVRPKKVPK